jgi:hypothetical protein
MTAGPTLAAIAAASMLAGCGIPNPNATTAPPSVPPARTGLRTPLARQRDPLLRVAVDYALTQATWSPDTYLAQKARLARLSTGRARAQLAVSTAAPAGVVAQLRAAGSSSTASLIGSDGPTAQHQVVVAYKVLATGVGRTAGRADYELAHITLTRHHRAWLVSDFAIQP